MKIFKKYYMLFLLILTLTIMGVYGTYAMFTHDINVDAVNLQASNIPVDEEIMEYEKVVIGANDAKTISLNISNSTSQVLHYGAWYQMVSPTTINDDITIAKLTDSPDETSGTIDGNSNKNVYIYIGNNSSSEITLYVGIKYSETGSLGLPDNRTLITNTRDGKYVVGVTVTNGTVENGVTLTNLVTNGSFEDGLNGWHVAGTNSSEGIVQSDIHTFGNYGYRGKSNINAQDNILWANSGPFTEVGHHYYVSQQIRNDADREFVTHANAGETHNAVFNVLNTNGKFIEVSDIAIADGLNNYFATAWGPGGANGAYWYTDDIMTIDLTDSYGSNYPPKEILDRSIGYFDGSVSYNYVKLNKGNNITFEVYPEAGYAIDNITCTNSNASYNEYNDTLTINNITGDVQCSVKFKVTKRTSSEMLAYLGLSAKSGTPNFGSTATTDEGIYSAQDDYGTSYYFRGAVENNYVKFANKYWRIIRINGDGTIRLIYDGTSAHANGESSTDRQIGTSAFNSKANTYESYDNFYLGYMYFYQYRNINTGGTFYQIRSSSSYEEATSNRASSAIKTVVDSWYKTNIQDVGYSDKVADVIYCNDRQIDIVSGYGNELGYGKNQTAYMPRYRLYTNKSPILTCTNQNDRFTVEDTSKGNGALTYPVGLITADEVSMAGGVNGTSNSSSNSSYYLYTGNYYWTMSPYHFNGSLAGVFIVRSDGNIYSYRVDSTYGVRPVLSLKSDVQLSGSGTMTDPYLVQ